MEQTKEHKERNKGGRPKKEATEKLKYRIAVKMTAADYFRLLTRSHEAGVSPSEYMWNRYERVFVAEYQQYKKIKVQKSGKGETGYKSCFLRK